WRTSRNPAVRSLICRQPGDRAMSGSGRQPLYTHARVVALVARMRSDLEEQHARHLSEMADLRREFDEVLGMFEQLRAAVRARQDAEAEPQQLYREREMVRGWATERDPAAPLQ